MKRLVVKHTGVFHSRQLFCDVFMTVHRALVAHSLEVLRLKPVDDAVAPRHSRTASVASLGRRGAALDKRLQDNLRGIGDQEQCLISVDVMNAYGQPFEVSLESCDSEGPSGLSLLQTFQCDTLNFSFPNQRLEQPSRFDNG